ncbi:MAG: Ig-like domain-containing protein [Burkholderiales bacterium]|nr:Ig-like domain-containing protein [Burkholderiales bacterium]
MALEFQTVVRGSAPQRLTLGEGRMRVPARPGSEFKIVDDAGKVIPGTSVKRVDNHLLVEGLPGGRSVEITDFFTACAPSGASSCSLSMAELGSTAGPITPASDPIAALPDGSFLLYGGVSPGGPAALSAPIVAAADNSWKAIGAGIGGLAIAGLAAGAGGGGGGGSTQDTTPPPPPAFTSKSALNGLAPTFTGTAEPGARVLVRIDVNQNGNAGDAGDVTFETIALADGTWRISTGDQAPVQGTYAVSAIARDVSGNLSTATNTTIAIDATAPTKPTVAVDSEINRAESLAGVTVSGTGEAGATITVVWGSVTKTGTVAADGTWSLLFGTTELPQAQGASVVSTTLTDEAGNVSPTESRVVVIDSVAPAAPAVTSGALTNSVQPKITGTAEPGSTVQLSIDRANNGTVDLVYSTPVPPSGIWEVNIATAVPAGASAPAALSDLSTNGLSVQATDASGNPGPSNTATLAIDVTLPSAPSIAAISGGFINSAERAAGVLISGTLDPVYANRPVTVSFGSGTSKVVTATGTTWSAAFAAGELPSVDATYTVTAVTSSAVGQPSLPGTQSVVVDTAAPAALGRSLAADTGISAVDGITSNGRVDVTGLEGGATWQYSTNAGASWTAGSGSFVTLTGDGAKSITVRQIDAAGNIGAPSAALGFTLDTTPPVTPGRTLAVDSGASATDGVTNDGLVNVSGLEVGAAWQYTLNGGTSWLTGTGASFTIATDGVYSVQVRQTDAAGFTSTSTALAVTLDTTAPAAAPTGTLAIDSALPDGITNSGLVNVTGVDAGATWQYSINAGSTWVSGTGSSVNLTGDGAKSVLFRQLDLAGSDGPVSAAPLTFTLDTTVPTATIADNFVGGAASAVGPVTFTFSLSEAVTGFDISDIDVFGGTAGALTAGGNETTYTLVVTPDPAAAASIDVQVLAGGFTDVAGNPNSASALAQQAYNTNVGRVSASALIDNGATAATTGLAIAPGTTTTDDTPRLTLTLDAVLTTGQSLQLLLDGAFVQTLAPTGASYAFQQITPLPSGAHFYGVQIVDAGGNILPIDLTPGAAGLTYTFTVA